MDNFYPEWARSQFTLRGTSVDGRPVVYLCGGTGPPVIMLHGLSGSLDWWQHNANALAEQFSVYLLDLPGFGRLGDLPQVATMSGYRDWVVKFMSQVGLERAHFIGHSMGAHVAARVAAAHPERVDRLVLVAPAGVLPDGDIEHFILPVVKVLKETPPSMFPLALRDIRRADIRTAWRAGNNLIEHDVLDLLPEVHAPTLLIWGDDDPVIPIELAGTFQERLPFSDLAVLPGAGHLPMVDFPGQFNSLVADFLHGTGRLATDSR